MYKSQEKNILKKDLSCVVSAFGKSKIDDY